MTPQFAAKTGVICRAEVGYAGINSWLSEAHDDRYAAPDPEVEAGILAHAREMGMVLEDYLLTLVEKAALPYGGVKVSAERAEAVRRMLEFGEKHHLSLGEPVTRAMMQEGHRF